MPSSPSCSQMADPTPLRGPRIRRAPLPNDARVVARGNDLDPKTNLRQAEAFLRRFPDWGRFGLSGYYARNDAEVNDLAADQLERFPLLDLFEVGDLSAAGFEVVPMFRTPHVTIAFAGEVHKRLEVLTAQRFEVRANPYHARRFPT